MKVQMVMALLLLSVLADSTVVMDCYVCQE